MTDADLAGYHSRIEQPYSVTYRGYAVHKAGPWNQSPVLLQTLNLLEGFDVRAMGHLSAASIHTMTEAMKLAYADRDRYYGDPDFVKVPMTGLLSKAYATRDARAHRPERARAWSSGGRPGAVRRADAGDDVGIRQHVQPSIRTSRASASTGESGDTTAIEVVDKDGNLFSATPSSGWLLGGAFVAGDTGVPMSNRMQAFRLEPGSPNIVARRQASAHHAHADHRHEGRRAGARDRHTGRRQPGPADPAGARERHRLRHAAAGGRRLGALQHAVDPELVRRAPDRARACWRSSAASRSRCAPTSRRAAIASGSTPSPPTRPASSPPASIRRPASSVAPRTCVASVPSSPGDVPVVGPVVPTRPVAVDAAASAPWPGWDSRPYLMARRLGADYPICSPAPVSMPSSASSRSALAVVPILLLLMLLPVHAGVCAARGRAAAAAAAVSGRQLVERRRQPGAARPRQRGLHHLDRQQARPPGLGRLGQRPERSDGDLRHAVRQRAGLAAARPGDLGGVRRRERRRRAGTPGRISDSARGEDRHRRTSRAASPATSTPAATGT